MAQTGIDTAYLSRKIDSELLSWMQESGRKPLLLRGARQVGKSSAVRQLAGHFDHFLEINFELDKNARELFAKSDLSPHRLCQELAAIYATPVIPGKTLLFLDEIQSSLPAISSLRFFYERYRDLHVVAAGSLLEFALQELSSFGVGRLRSMFMYPMGFFEFLNACNQQLLIQAVQNANCKNPLSEVLHKKVNEYLRKFLIEVKSNTKGAMQSMRLFLEEKHSPFGIRTSLENFGELSNVKIVPLYALGNFLSP